MRLIIAGVVTLLLVSCGEKEQPKDPLQGHWLGTELRTFSGKLLVENSVVLTISGEKLRFTPLETGADPKIQQAFFEGTCLSRFRKFEYRDESILVSGGTKCYGTDFKVNFVNESALELTVWSGEDLLMRFKKINDDEVYRVTSPRPQCLLSTIGPLSYEYQPPSFSNQETLVRSVKYSENEKDEAEGQQERYDHLKGFKRDNAIYSFERYTHRFSLNSPADVAAMKDACAQDLTVEAGRLGKEAVLNILTAAPLSSIPGRPEAGRPAQHSLVIWGCYAPCHWAKN